MALDTFGFTPPIGLSDKSAFPTYPATEDEARAQFMVLFNQVKGGVNTLIDVLNNKIALTSGAEQIGSAPIDGVVGDTIFEQLASMKLIVDNATAGTLPDLSITNNKIGNGEIELAKLSNATKAAFAAQNDLAVLQENYARLLFKLYMTGDVAELATELGVDGVLYDYFKSTGMVDAVNTNVKVIPYGLGGKTYMNNFMRLPVGQYFSNSLGTLSMMSNSERIYDGDDSTYAVLQYSSSSYLGAQPNTTFDLGAVVDTNQIRVKLHTTVNSSNSDGATLLVSADNGSYIPIKSWTRTELLATVDEKVNVNANVRYVRFSSTNNYFRDDSAGMFEIYACEVYQKAGVGKLYTASKDVDTDASRVDVSILSNNDKLLKVDVSVDGGSAYTAATFESRETILGGTTVYEHKYNALFATPGQNIKLKIYAADGTENFDTILYGWYLFTTINE